MRRSVRMKFNEIDWCFLYFPLLLQRKDTKGKQPEKPFLRERFLATLPKRGGAFALLRRECIPTGTNYGTLTPSVRASADFTGWLLFLRFRHGVGIEGLCSEGML